CCSPLQQTSPNSPSPSSFQIVPRVFQPPCQPGRGSRTSRGGAMRNFFRELDANLSNALSPVIKWIIYLCVGVFIIFLITSPFSASIGSGIFYLLGASVSDTILKGRIWQLVTY